MGEKRTKADFSLFGKGSSMPGERVTEIECQEGRKRKRKRQERGEGEGEEGGREVMCTRMAVPSCDVKANDRAKDVTKKISAHRDVTQTFFAMSHHSSLIGCLDRSSSEVSQKESVTL